MRGRFSLTRRYENLIEAMIEICSPLSPWKINAIIDSFSGLSDDPGGRKGEGLLREERGTVGNRLLDF